MNTTTQNVDVPSFFADLLYFLDQCDSNDMLAGYEIKQAEDVRDHVAEQAGILDRIAAELSGTEWNADMLDTIADLIRESGREVRDVTVDYGDDDELVAGDA